MKPWLIDKGLKFREKVQSHKCHPVTAETQIACMSRNFRESHAAACHPHSKFSILVRASHPTHPHPVFTDFVFMATSVIRHHCRAAGVNTAEVHYTQNVFPASYLAPLPGVLFLRSSEWTSYSYTQMKVLLILPGPPAADCRLNNDTGNGFDACEGAFNEQLLTYYLLQFCTYMCCKYKVYLAKTFLECSDFVRILLREMIQYRKTHVQHLFSMCVLDLHMRLTGCAYNLGPGGWTAAVNWLISVIVALSVVLQALLVVLWESQLH